MFETNDAVAWQQNGLSITANEKSARHFVAPFYSGAFVKYLSHNYIENNELWTIIYCMNNNH